MKVSLYLVVFFLLTLLVGCNGCTTLPSLSQRQLNKMVIIQNDQECSFVVVDPEDQMFLTVITSDEKVLEFSPQIHTLVVFAEDKTTGFKRVAFTAMARLSFGEKDLTITTIEPFEINQPMFLMLIEKYNLLHIDLEEEINESNSAPKPIATNRAKTA